jgi:L-histidine N-alpha-methyltransferase
MSSVASVTIHSSQFPDQIRRDLLESLRSRRVNHKFLYDSAKQTAKWLELHNACSPSRNDADCTAVYDKSFREAAGSIANRSVHVIGLGCGGGQKDTRLLKLLRKKGSRVAYTPCDVSVAMVLEARKTTLAVVPEQNCHPVVCDLVTAEDIAKLLDKLTPPKAARLITFFGMIPNFEPQVILPRLTGLLRPADWLLFSANLAPGPNFAAGVRRILPLYDNDLTRGWLMLFLADVGVESSDGKLNFVIEDNSGLKRIAAHFHFAKSRRVILNGETFHFQRGESIRLFFSYRHTPSIIRALLAKNRLHVLEEWITKSEEEGVFLCRRK